jgi:hypothetical protein
VSIYRRVITAKLTKPQKGWDEELRDLVIQKKAVRPLPSFSFFSFSLSTATALLNLTFFPFPLHLPLRFFLDVTSGAQPRKLFVQPNMFLDGEGKVVLKEYELSVKGVIESCVERRGF